MIVSRTINEFWEVVRSRRESTIIIPITRTVFNVAGSAIDLGSIAHNRAIASEIKKYAISCVSNSKLRKRMIESTPKSANPTAVDNGLNDSTVRTENNPMLQAK